MLEAGEDGSKLEASLTYVVRPSFKKENKQAKINNKQNETRHSTEK